MKHFFNQNISIKILFKVNEFENFLKLKMSILIFDFYFKSNSISLSYNFIDKLSFKKIF